MAFFFTAIISLLLAYILFNLNIFHTNLVLSKPEINTYSSHIDTSSVLQFVAEKFDKHDVVFLGEFHKRKQDLVFFKTLIPYLCKTKGIKTIGWEFGAANYQKDADSIVTAAEFDRAKSIAIMRNSNYCWCYEDYLVIFKAIWQLNKTIPQDSDKVRFLQLNKPYVPKRWDSSIDTVRLNERKIRFDNILPDIVKREVIQKNKKILIYCGWEHSLTRFQTAKFFFLKDNEGRAGERLLHEYPQKICQLWLIAPFPPRWWFYKQITNSKDIKFVYPFQGISNQLYDRLKRPFAIDADNPLFSGLRDYDSFYAFDKLNGIKFKDFCDGAIMLAPFDEIEPVDIIKDWVTTQKELNEVKNILPDKDAREINTIDGLMNFINPALDQNEIREIHQLKKFW